MLILARVLAQRIHLTSISEINLSLVKYDENSWIVTTFEFQRTSLEGKETVLGQSDEASLIIEENRELFTHKNNKLRNILLFPHHSRSETPKDILKTYDLENNKRVILRETIPRTGLRPKQWIVINMNGLGHLNNELLRVTEKHARFKNRRTKNNVAVNVTTMTSLHTFQPKFLLKFDEREEYEK